MLTILIDSFNDSFELSHLKHFISFTPRSNVKYEF